MRLFGFGGTGSERCSPPRSERNGSNNCEPIPIGSAIWVRYPTSEKLEIIQLVEQCHLSARRTLDKLGIPRTTFYRWYDLYQTGGMEALEDKSPKSGRVWNRIPD